ncbi:thiamine pyrophosphate-dependent dehydrogenase E1 component subunit alpha [Leucobacter sp. CSA1]|uniref:Thiamine pyrophosphate-dependent dehydrogenase E1 component subunit alpha n=1 Tax=Leucobacter chromiisoli TaxID=2796471 RepID=A0A934Q7J8_9MICO|nr:thiamine pyrophosphate-dependent dehydrogenase E1 component subunit alpha [Leucobacter chromiisoli]MBK0418918.1 thiamine pyrophosphate-dependent dehydrogenase E1 component subunit alpha [Leucobacter chromiisoli]
MPYTSLEVYRLMRLMREFEEACIRGVADRQIHGEVHVGVGQEAIGAGLAGVLRDSDAMVGTHRSHLHAIAKGVPLHPLLAEIFERETGLCGGFGGHMHLFDPHRKFSTTGIVGGTLPVALGHAYAARLRGGDEVAVAVIGDGSANTGGFAESMNMAGAMRLPLVVVVENNEWAISVPFSEASATPTIAERAPAYAARGVHVDGLDRDAVHAAFADAVESARRGEGPVIVEATCYRFRGHYEGDLDLYRDAFEKEARLADKDPLMIARNELIAGGHATAEDIDGVDADVRGEIGALVDRVLDEPFPDPATARRHVFSSGLDLPAGV